MKFKELSHECVVTYETNNYLMIEHRKHRSRHNRETKRTETRAARRHTRTDGVTKRHERQISNRP